MGGITYVIRAVGEWEHFGLRFIGERAVFERDNRIYYERRWAQATALGDRATDPKIAAIHYELALRYAISSVRANEPRQNVVAFTEERRGGPPARALFGGTAEHQPKQALQEA